MTTDESIYQNDCGSAELRSSHVSKLSSMINDERKVLLKEIRSRLLRLKSIVDIKLARNIPVNKRELACLKRFSFVLDDIDTLEASSKKIADKIIRAAEVEDGDPLINIELFPRVESPPSPKSEELDVQNLIAEYVQQGQYVSFGEALKGIRVSDIIAAVDMENGNSKAGKKVKRKTGRTKGAIKRNNQSPAKKAKSRNQLRSLPPVLTQYVRGFFNVLRIILLTLGDAGGLSTEHLCDIVHFWNLDPRVQRTNSPWIISSYACQCADWSELVRPALALLSGRSPLTGPSRTASKESAGSVDLERLLPPAFVVFNAATRMWCWVDNGLDEENEASLLARLFALWLKKNGTLKHLRSHLDELDKEEVEDEDGDEDEEDRSRRRALRIDRIPPPHL
ncbi:hypothetical protein TSMEX_001615 [Taenia solium]|eukprot:TsM_000585500 transcript=TsM_000585500 gene=TsM_000585500